MLRAEPFRAFSGAFINYYQLHQFGLLRFRQKIRIQGEVGPFRYKTVSNQNELLAALALRFDIFHREMLGVKSQGRLDVDEFDRDCDHLVIFDKRSDKLVATYRLNCSLFAKKFYSAQEFHMSSLLDGSVQLELGRACIAKDFRRSIVLSVLWRGIAEYMVATGAKQLFGCATVKTTSPRQAALLWQYFIEKQFSLEAGGEIVPTPAFTCPDFSHWEKYFARPLTAVEVEEAETLVPALCRAYLRMGAKIAGPPAFDQDFQCFDFLTSMRREDIDRALWRRLH